MKFIKALLGLVVLVVVGLVALGGYLGFVPVISSWFGSDKPRDLGVTATAEDLWSATEKMPVIFETLPADTPDAQSLQFSGTLSVRQAFTNEEMTAIFNNCKWKYCLVSGVQVLTHHDGSVEMSGILNFDHAEGYARAFGVSEEDLAVAKNYLGYIKTNPPFYAAGKISITNNQVALDVTSVVIGRLVFPEAIIKDSDALAESFIEGQMSHLTGLSVSSMTFAGGQMQFDGTVPEIQSIVQ